MSGKLGVWEEDNHERCEGHRVERHVRDELRGCHQRGRIPRHPDAGGRGGGGGEGHERPDGGRQHQGVQGQPGGDLRAGGRRLEGTGNEPPATPGRGPSGLRPFLRAILSRGTGERGMGWRWETATDPASPGAPTSPPATPWTSWPNGTSWSCGGRTARRWQPSGRWGRTR